MSASKFLTEPSVGIVQLGGYAGLTVAIGDAYQTHWVAAGVAVGVSAVWFGAHFLVKRRAR